MHDHYYSIANSFTLAVRTPINLSQNPETLFKLGAFLPDVQEITTQSAQPNVVLEHIYGAHTKLNVAPKHVTLTTPSTAGEALPEDFYHLLYGVVRKEMFEQQQLCCIHAACVGAGEDFKLLVGHSGAGKTTLAQHAIDRYGVKLFSGNKTVLRFEQDGRITSLGGTKTMTALDIDGKRYAYSVPKSDIEPKSAVNITSIDFVRLNDGVAKIENLSPLSALHTLYPLVLDQVNSDVIIGGNHLYDGSLSNEAKQTALESLRASTEQIPVRKITGSKQFITRALHHG